MIISKLKKTYNWSFGIRPMTAENEVLINSRPLRTKIRDSESIDEVQKELEAFERVAYSNSSGVIISYKNGVGEVLTQENFEDSGVHFIFSRSTSLQFNTDFDPIGIGSVVQIYWSRSFERIIKSSHIIVQIEKMEVFKCCTLVKDTIFVTFNSQTTPGVAIGVNERNMTVAIHPNCFSDIRYETLKALSASRTEFELKYKQRENTNRMIDVILASVPFNIEIAGNVDKIPFFVIEKLGDAPGKQGVAVITKIVKHHFIEASFLHSSESVYFDSNSCHSNILDKVHVGSLIDILASPTFPSSCFKWYGYDVTMSGNYLADSETQKSFTLENNQILQNLSEKMKKSAKSARDEMKFEVAPEKVQINKKKTKGIRKFYSKNAQYKLKHILLDENTSLLPAREVRNTVDSYFLDRFEKFADIPGDSSEEDDIPSAKYSESLKNVIQSVLEPFGLNKPGSYQKSPKNMEIRFAEASSSEKWRKSDIKRKTAEEIREKFADLMDSKGFAKNQKISAKFELPDTKWQPMERRYIDIHDNLQWVMMATFCEIPENPPQTQKLAGGWWYRRSVPRDHPIEIVEKLETRRNIIKDCTESMRP